MTPNYAVFRQIYVIATKNGKGYDYLPDLGASYPFYFVAENYDANRKNNDLIGDVSQVVHIYGLRRQRKEVDRMIVALHDEAQKLRHADGYNIRLVDYRSRLLPDNTTGEALLHAVVDLDFRYTKKESV